MTTKAETKRLSRLNKDESGNIAKTYKLPEAAVRIIEKPGKVHGQQSRAIQIAVELLWNKVGYGVSDEAMKRILNTDTVGQDL